MDAMTLFLNGDRAILPGRAGWLRITSASLSRLLAARTTRIATAPANISKGRAPLAGLGRGPGEFPNVARRQAFVTLKLPRPSRSPI